ncbi:MAG: hypothetical protein ACK53Y_18260, partial [bacterium]
LGLHGSLRLAVYSLGFTYRTFGSTIRRCNAPREAKPNCTRHSSAVAGCLHGLMLLSTVSSATRR